MISRPFITPRKTRMRMNLDHVASGHFVLGRDVLCEFDYWPLAVSMPPTKVCPQCKAAVPVRRKTCERCDHVFRSKRKAECNLWEKAMKHMGAVEKLKISCTRPVKERQKLVRQLCIGRNKTECAWQAWESHETVIDSSQHTSTITCTAAPRVWHFSAFHYPCSSFKQMHLSTDV